jgi:hypothetical protein
MAPVRHEAIPIEPKRAVSGRVLQHKMPEILDFSGFMNELMKKTLIIHIDTQCFRCNF